MNLLYKNQRKRHIQTHVQLNITLHSLINNIYIYNYTKKFTLEYIVYTYIYKYERRSGSTNILIICLCQYELTVIVHIVKLIV